jgi:hypothetical protein
LQIRKETACKRLTCLPPRSNNSGRGGLGPGRSFILKQRKIKVELKGTEKEDPDALISVPDLETEISPFLIKDA